MTTSTETHEWIELDVLIEAIRLRHGYDFRNYARASLFRRVTHRMKTEGLPNISAMVPLVIHDPAFFERLLFDLSITVTEMFRHPPFYRRFREVVVPWLRTFAVRKIWHAGCATGEEAYSMAVLLHEEGLLSTTRIYATDFNAHALTVAKRGIYDLSALVAAEEPYAESGGKSRLSDYYRSQYGAGKLSAELVDAVTFSTHNLVTDAVFGEMQVIVCRNVLIYFDSDLQAAVVRLFLKSLSHRGFLCLGDCETISSAEVAGRFERLSQAGTIYRACSRPEQSRPGA